MRIKEAKTHLRSFMRNHYSDERLAWLLAHARAGKLAYDSCCCFVGIVTATHALKQHVNIDLCGVQQDHYQQAQFLPGAHLAERAYFHLGSGEGDPCRRRIIIPMIRAEQRRRERARRAVDQLDAFLIEKGTMKELTTA
jgi:hypothetical protein